MIAVTISGSEPSLFLLVWHTIEMGQSVLPLAEKENHQWQN
jgi:hypothetical protein